MSAAIQPLIQQSMQHINTVEAEPTAENMEAIAPCDDSQTLLDKLPPMPTPDLRTQRTESAMGCTFVISIIAACIGVGHGAAYSLDDSPAAAVILLSVIYAQAFLALLCLAGLMWGDPGVVKRGPSTQLPIPDAVAERLQAGRSLDGLDNITDPVHGSFCVRCCVWRPPPLTRQQQRHQCAPNNSWQDKLCGCFAGNRQPKKAHHCSICQRCVVDFDHHW
eukprot:SAG31_NODE_3342_length_4383_cov_5.306723_6_plen_220_part_00